MTEVTKGLGQREAKVATKDFFIFDSLFSSKNLAKSAIGVGADMVDMVKINTHGLFKGII